MKVSWSACTRHDHHPEAITVIARGDEESLAAALEYRNACFLSLAYIDDCWSYSLQSGWKMDLYSMTRLANLAQLTELHLHRVVFTETARFPKSLIKLHVNNSVFWEGIDWTTLSQLRSLNFNDVRGLSDKYVVGCRLPNLETLCLDCDSVHSLLCELDLDRLQSLNLTSFFSSRPIMRIATALRCGTMKRLALPLCNTNVGENIRKLILPAIAHSNLTSLKLYGYQLAEKEQCKFDIRMTLLTLLLARKPHRKLRKLPVEMFRLVGMMLM